MVDSARNKEIANADTVSEDALPKVISNKSARMFRWDLFLAEIKTKLPLLFAACCGAICGKSASKWYF